MAHPYFWGILHQWFRFLFTSGGAGGIYTVADFKQGTDVLLAPNGFSSVATQASDGNGGTLLTLSDGSRIDLLGIASIHASDFG